MAISESRTGGSGALMAPDALYRVRGRPIVGPAKGDLSTPRDSVGDTGMRGFVDAFVDDALARPALAWEASEVNGRSNATTEAGGMTEAERVILEELKAEVSAAHDRAISRLRALASSHPTSRKSPVPLPEKPAGAATGR